MAQSDREGTTHWAGCEAVHGHGSSTPTDGPSVPAQPQQPAQGYQPTAAPAGAAPAQRTSLTDSMTWLALSMDMMERQIAMRPRGKDSVEMGVNWATEVIRHSRLLLEQFALRTPASAPAQHNLVLEIDAAIQSVFAPLIQIRKQPHMKGKTGEPDLIALRDGVRHVVQNKLLYAPQAAPAAAVPDDCIAGGEHEWGWTAFVDVTQPSGHHSAQTCRNCGIYKSQWEAHLLDRALLPSASTDAGAAESEDGTADGKMTIRSRSGGRFSIVMQDGTILGTYDNREVAEAILNEMGGDGDDNG